MKNELSNGVSTSLLLGAGFFLWKKYASIYVLCIYERTGYFVLPHGICLRWYLLQYRKGGNKAVPLPKIFLPKHFGQKTIAFVRIALAHALVSLDFVPFAPAYF